jgi:hypothetical protein
MFIRMSPEDRLLANDNSFRTILELRDAFKQQKTDEHMIKLKKTSTNIKDKQRLAVLEETLRQ